MKNIIVLIFIACSFQAQAQYGITASFVSQNVPGWESITVEQYGNDAQDDFLDTGFEVAFDYWFRLKKFRVEFYPTVSYSRFSTDLVNPFLDSSSAAGTFAQNNIGLHLKTNIYPLDFEGDCDCPTWEKDGSIIKKGWFIQLIVGGKFLNNNFDEINDFSNTNNVYTFDYGVGTGLDIGVSEFLTVTPFANYVISTEVEWLDLDKLPAFAANAPTNEDLNFNPTDVNRWVFGIRLGFRFDELNKYGYR